MESLGGETKTQYRQGRNWLLAVIFIAGLGFRLFGIQWGIPSYFHPDERQIMYQVTDLSWQEPNPKFFAYGSLPMYFLKGILFSLDIINKGISGALTSIDFSPEVKSAIREAFPRMNNFESMVLTGRAVSAFLSACTILVIFYLAQTIYNRKIGLIAAALFAFTVLSIQQSHFYVVDGPQTFLITCALLFIVRIVQSDRNRDYYYSALFIGMAMATKVSSSPIYLAFFLAQVLAVANGKRKGWNSWAHWVAAGLLSVVVMTACMPYWILDFDKFYSDVNEQKRMVTGAVTLPYTIQYAHTTPYLYLIRNMIFWSMGLPLGLAAYIGFALGIIRVFRKRSDTGNLILLAWLIPLFILNSTFQVKFLRYTLPMFPVFAILAARWLHDLHHTIGRFRARLVNVVVIGGALFWSIAFSAIYTEPNTRHVASDWVYENIPKGSNIVLESNWDDSLPVSTNGNNRPDDYHFDKLEIYQEPDNARKAGNMTQILEWGDVVILASKRHYGSVLRVPDRYPISSNFYRALFAERLGYRYVKSFTNPPHLGPMKFRDDLADESFGVYEHAKVDVFVKETYLSSEQLLPYLVSPPKDVSNLTYEEILTAIPVSEVGSSVDMPVLRWILTIELLGLIVFPFVFLIFHQFEHRGYPLTKITGLMIAGYFAWLIPSLKLLPFSNSLIVLVLVTLAFINYMIYQSRKQAIQQFFRERWWSILGYELLFFCIFTIFALLKAYNPDIYWSESSMDFGFLNSVLRADYFPPADPWIQGEGINYYYYGHYLAAFITKFAGVTADYGYNLFFITIPTMVALAVCSIVIALTRRIWAGMMSVLITILIGNLDGIAQYARIWASAARNTALADWANLFQSFVGLFLNLGRQANHFRFFRSAHELINPTVHEFPFWSYNFMDLHAHTIATMISSFIIALHLVLFRNKKNGIALFGTGFTRYATIFLMLVSIGSLIPTNSWDFPTHIGIILLISLWFTAFEPRQHRDKRIVSAEPPKPASQQIPHESAPQETSPESARASDIKTDALAEQPELDDISENSASEQPTPGEILADDLQEKDYGSISHSEPVETIAHIQNQKTRIIPQVTLSSDDSSDLIQTKEEEPTDHLVVSDAKQAEFASASSDNTIVSQKMEIEEESLTIEDPESSILNKEELESGSDTENAQDSLTDAASESVSDEDRELCGGKDPEVAGLEPTEISPVTDLSAIPPIPRKSFKERMIAFSRFAVTESIENVQFLWTLLVPCIVLVVGAIVLYLPYLMHFSRKGMGVGTLWKHRQTTNLDGFITMFGLFLFIITTQVIRWWYHVNRQKGRSITRIYVYGGAIFFGLLGVYSIFRFIPPLQIDYAVFLWSVCVGVMIIYILLSGKPTLNQVFVLLLALMAFAITAGCEIFFIKDFYQGGDHRRFNTIFKFYLQAWFLFGIVSAYFLANRSLISIPDHPTRFIKRMSRLSRWVWNAIFIVLLGCSLIFTVEGPRARRHHDEYNRVELPLTLDGWAYMKQGEWKNEYRAVDWLNKNVKGYATLLEASGADYLYKYAKISANTGLPCVLGWWSHVDQREYQRNTGKMKQDIVTMYESLDVPEVLELLRLYQVDYIYVGKTEKAEYSDAGISKFAELTDYMTPAYANPDVTIYKVNDYGLNVDFAKVAADSDALAKLQERLEQEAVRRKEEAEKAEEARTAAIRNMPPRTVFQGGQGESRGMFDEPRSMTTDADGTIYVADFRNHRIQKFDPDGNWILAWGTTGSEPGQFNDLCDVAVDADGVYVADTFNNRIQKFTHTGEFVKTWVTDQGNYFYPRGIATDGKGYVYLADTGNGRIIKYTNDGKEVAIFGKLGKGPGEFDTPIGICVFNDQLIILDTHNFRVQILDTNGNFIKEWKFNGWEGDVFVEPYVVADKSGRIWISDPTKRFVAVYDPDGNLIKTFRSATDDSQPFILPMGLALDKAGDILVIDAHHYRVFKIKSDF